MREQDISYFRRRIDQEMDRARIATEPTAVRVHRELAEHYATALRTAGIDAADPYRCH